MIVPIFLLRILADELYRQVSEELLLALLSDIDYRRASYNGCFSSSLYRYTFSGAWQYL
jgi:hypothetical protein